MNTTANKNAQRNNGKNRHPQPQQKTGKKQGTPMRDQLAGLVKEMYASDGVDHVRLNKGATTEAGRTLSKSTHIPFSVPGMGNFKSVVCFVGWAITGNDECRTNERVRTGRTTLSIDALYMYGKFFQLLAVADRLREPVYSLPFVEYVIHPETNLREFVRPNTWGNLMRKYVDLIRAGTTNAEDAFKGIPRLSNMREQILKNMASKGLIVAPAPKPVEVPKAVVADDELPELDNSVAGATAIEPVSEVPAEVKPELEEERVDSASHEASSSEVQELEVNEEVSEANDKLVEDSLQNPSDMSREIAQHMVERGLTEQ